MITKATVIPIAPFLEIYFVAAPIIKAPAIGSIY